MKRGLSADIKVDSAGASSAHQGEALYAKLQEVGMSTRGMASRPLRTSDLTFGYLVCMDASNVENTRHRLKSDSDKIFRFLDLTPHKKDVPALWYTGDFNETYELCVGLHGAA